MKTIITSLILAFISYNASAQNVKITLTNVSQKGSLRVGLCTSDKDFQTADFLVAQAFKVSENTGTVTAYFQIPDGNYGVAIYLDVNGNNQFDYGTDMYGFSNHFKPMGAPSYEDFSFNLKGKYEETIALSR